MKMVDEDLLDMYIDGILLKGFLIFFPFFGGFDCGIYMPWVEKNENGLLHSFVLDQ